MKARLFLVAGALLMSCAVVRDRRIAELERRLEQRDREIAELRRRLPAEPAGRPDADEPLPTDDVDEMTRALEIALVRQGGTVLGRWVVQVEPELAYTYSERDRPRRDTFTSSLTVRAGLPGSLQADIYVPYVLYDRRSGAESSSDIGDISLGLTKRLVAETESVPELLVSGRWKTRSGNSSRDLQTGTGADALQAAITAVKTKEPIVLFASPAYTAHLSADDIDYGDTVGAKLGVFLAATPDTSLLLDVDVNSSFATRVGGFEIGDSDRLSGVVELGLATILRRTTLLNVTAGIGFTDSAPDFRLATSLPITRY